MQWVQWQIPTGFHKIIVSGPLTPPEGFRVMLSWKIDAERIAAATVIAVLLIYEEINYNTKGAEFKTG